MYPKEGLLTVRKLSMNSIPTPTLGKRVSEKATEAKELIPIKDRPGVRWVAASPIARDCKSPYATIEDFRELFIDEMIGLYLLLYLLTAKHIEAEACFSDGFGECIVSPRVLRDSARSWARRTLIRSAIRIIDPRVSSYRRVSDGGHSRADLIIPWNIRSDAFLASVLALQDFERFVFVISVIERDLDQNCASLLGASKRRVQDSRVRALRQIAETEGRSASTTSIANRGSLL
jgi:hypothetical protein